MSILGGHRVPSWVAVLAQSASAARIIARPPLESGSVAAAYDLTIQYGIDGLEVAETKLETRLPKQCPELHIMGRGVFCLSRDEDQFRSPELAAAFWKRLGDYLVDQHIAERQRKWPAGRWLSHGYRAADEQEAAEAIAAKNGWSDDYANAIENNAGWIAEAAHRPEGAEVNCPCLADSAAPGRRCRHRRDLRMIVACERRRRQAERRHLDFLYSSGLRCCGRIDGCQLEVGPQ